MIQLLMSKLQDLLMISLKKLWNRLIIFAVIKWFYFLNYTANIFRELDEINLISICKYIITIMFRRKQGQKCIRKISIKIRG